MNNETPANVRLRGIPECIKSDLNNISDNLGISLTQMLKPILREVSESYSAKMKNPVEKKKKKKENEIVVRGIGKKLKTDLENISENVELSIAQITIPKLQAFIASQPERMKRPLDKF